MATTIVGLDGKCIDIKSGNNAAGTPLILWDVNGGNNQKWNFTFDNLIESALDPTKCIDIAGGVTNIGAKVIISEKTGTPSQKWIIDPQGHLTSLLDPNMCISAGGALQFTFSGRKVIPGFELELRRTNHPRDFGQSWRTAIITAPQVQINLSYKILINPVTGAIPGTNTIAGIQTVVQQMNELCVRLNTSFRFRLFEEPVLIGGPNASGQVNFWYNTWMKEEHRKPFENSAKVFFLDCDINDPNYVQCAINRNQSHDYFAWRDKAVNLYFTGVGWGGIASFPGNGDFIALCVNADCNIQIHELGHFFGLGHTMGDDGIADTLVDNEHWDKNAIAMNNFNRPYNDPNMPLTAPQREQVDNAWNNIMSYHGPSHLSSVLTVDQLKKWDKVMRNQRADVIQV